MADKTPAEIKAEQTARSTQALGQSNNPGLISLAYIRGQVNDKHPRIIHPHGMTPDEIQRAQNDGLILDHEISSEGRKGLEHASENARFSPDTGLSTLLIKDSIIAVTRQDHDGQASLYDLVNNAGNTGSAKGLRRVFHENLTDQETLESYLSDDYQEINGYDQIELGFIENRFAELSADFKAKGNGTSLREHLGVPEGTDLSKFKFSADKPEHMRVLTNLVFTVLHHDISDQQLQSYANAERSAPAPQDVSPEALDERIENFKGTMNDFRRFSFHYSDTYQNLFFSEWFATDVELPSEENKIKLDINNGINHDLFFGDNEFSKTLISEANEFANKFNLDGEKISFHGANGFVINKTLEELHDRVEFRDIYYNDPGNISAWSAEQENYIRAFLHQHRTTDNARQYFANSYEKNRQASSGELGSGATNFAGYALRKLENLEERYYDTIDHMEELLEMNGHIIPLRQMQHNSEAIITFLNENSPILAGAQGHSLDTELTDPEVVVAVNSILAEKNNTNVLTQFKNISGGYSIDRLHNIQKMSLTLAQQAELGTIEGDMATTELQSFMLKVMAQDNSTGVNDNFEANGKINDPDFITGITRAIIYAHGNPTTNTAKEFTERWGYIKERYPEITGEIESDIQEIHADKQNTANLLHFRKQLQATPFNGATDFDPNEDLDNPATDVTMRNLRLAVTSIQNIIVSGSSENGLLRATGLQKPIMPQHMGAAFRIFGVKPPELSQPKGYTKEQISNVENAMIETVSRFTSIPTSDLPQNLQYIQKNLSTFPLAVAINELRAQPPFLINSENQPVSSEPEARPISFIEYLYITDEKLSGLEIGSQVNSIIEQYMTALATDQNKQLQAAFDAHPNLQKALDISTNPALLNEHMAKVEPTGVPSEETLLTMQALYIAIHDPSNEALSNSAKKQIAQALTQGVNLYGSYIALDDESKTAIQKSLTQEPDAPAETAIPEPIATPEPPPERALPGGGDSYTEQSTPADMRSFIEKNEALFLAIETTNPMVLDQIYVAVHEQYGAQVSALDLGVDIDPEDTQEIEKSIQTIVEDTLGILKSLSPSEVPPQFHNALFGNDDNDPQIGLLGKVKDMSWREALGELTSHESLIILDKENQIAYGDKSQLMPSEVSYLRSSGIALDPIMVILGLGGDNSFQMKNNAALEYVRVTQNRYLTGFDNVVNAETRDQLIAANAIATDPTALSAAMIAIQSPDNPPEDTLTTLRALEIVLQNPANNIGDEQRAQLTATIKDFETALNQQQPPAQTAEWLVEENAENVQAPTKEPAPPAPEPQEPAIDELAELRTYIETNKALFHIIETTDTLPVLQIEVERLKMRGIEIKDVPEQQDEEDANRYIGELASIVKEGREALKTKHPELELIKVTDPEVLNNALKKATQDSAPYAELIIALDTLRLSASDPTNHDFDGKRVEMIANLAHYKELVIAAQELSKITPEATPEPKEQTPAAKEQPKEEPKAPQTLQGALADMRTYIGANKSLLHPVEPGSDIIIALGILKTYGVEGLDDVDLSSPEGTLDDYLRDLVKTAQNGLEKFDPKKPPAAYGTNINADAVTTLLASIGKIDAGSGSWEKKLNVLNSTKISNNNTTAIELAYTLAGKENGAEASEVSGRFIDAIAKLSEKYNELPETTRKEYVSNLNLAHMTPKEFEATLNVITNSSTSDENSLAILQVLEISALDPANTGLDKNGKRAEILGRIGGYKNILEAALEPEATKDAAVKIAIEDLAVIINPPEETGTPVHAEVDVTVAPEEAREPVHAEVSVTVPVETTGPKLPGNTGPEKAPGAVPTEPKTSKYDDPAVIQRIKEFQIINGLDPQDGELNEATIQKLTQQVQGHPLSVYIENHGHRVSISNGEQYYIDDTGNIYGTDDAGNRDTAKEIGHIRDMSPPSAQAMEVLEEVLNKVQFDTLRAYEGKKLRSYDKQQREALGSIIGDKAEREEVLNLIHDAKDGKEVKNLLRGHFKDNEDYKSLTILTSVLWSIEQQRDIYDRAPDFSALAEDFENDDYFLFHSVAALHDIFSFFRTDKMVSTLDHLRGTAYRPSSLSRGIDDRLFDPEVYDQLDERGQVDGALVGRPGETLSRADISEIALERLEQAARDAGIEPGEISSAMLNGKFNPYFEDIILAHEGLVPDGSMTISNELKAAMLEIGEKYKDDDEAHDQALGELRKEVLAGKYPNSDPNPISPTRVLHLREIGIIANDETMPHITYLHGEYVGTRNKLWNERFGSIENIKSADMMVNGEPRDMSSMDIGMRALQRVHAAHFKIEFGIGLDADMTYEEAIDQLEPAKAAQLEQEIKVYLGRESIVSYFRMGGMPESDHNLRQDYQDLRTKSYMPEIENRIKARLSPEQELAIKAPAQEEEKEAKPSQAEKKAEFQDNGKDAGDTPPITPESAPAPEHNHSHGHG